MKKIIPLSVIILALIAAVGCGGKKTPSLAPEIASSDEALFKEGEKYQKKDREKARLYFRQVIDSFPKSFYAQRAKLAIADSFYAEGDEGSLILAASEYREFISLYPYSPSAPYAQYRIGLSFFDKTLKPGRDQTKTVQALAEFKKVVTLYPLSEEAKLSQTKIRETEDRYAEHLFTIAEHYFKVDAFKAAITRLNEILTTYPLFKGLDKVFYYLGASLDKSGTPDQAVAYYTKVVTDYPKSKLAIKAQDRLKEIKAGQDAKPKK